MGKAQMGGCGIACGRGWVGWLGRFAAQHSALQLAGLEVKTRRAQRWLYRLDLHTHHLEKSCTTVQPWGACGSQILLCFLICMS